MSEALAVSLFFPVKCGMSTRFLHIFDIIRTNSTSSPVKGYQKHPQRGRVKNLKAVECFTDHTNDSLIKLYTSFANLDVLEPRLGMC